jgi:hypothetical protein
MENKTNCGPLEDKDVADYDAFLGSKRFKEMKTPEKLSRDMQIELFGHAAENIGKVSLLKEMRKKGFSWEYDNLIVADPNCNRYLDRLYYSIPGWPPKPDFKEIEAYVSRIKETWPHEELKERGVDVSMSINHILVNGNIENLKRWAKKVDAQEFPYFWCKSPCRFAIVADDLECLKFLVEKYGVDRPVYETIYHMELLGAVECMKYLLDKYSFGELDKMRENKLVMCNKSVHESWSAAFMKKIAGE